MAPIRPPLLVDGPIDARRRVVVFGDSWAGHRRLNAGLIEALGPGTRVCSIGFPGASTGALVDHLDAVMTGLRDGAGGWADDCVLIGGINDYLTRRGPDFYRRHILDLSHTAHQLAERVHVLELPLVEDGRLPARPIGRLKRLGYSLLFEHRSGHSIDAYRMAFPTGYFSLIPYSGFADRFIEGDFHGDGVHMTPQGYERLGGYVGRWLASGRYDAPVQTLQMTL